MLEHETGLEPATPTLAIRFTAREMAQLSLETPARSRRRRQEGARGLPMGSHRLARWAPVRGRNSRLIDEQTDLVVGV